MALIDSWKTLNKMDKGNTKSNQLGYEVKENSALNISIGNMSHRSNEDLSKEEFFSNIKTEITPNHMSKMISIASKSPNINMFFKMLSEEGVPLEFLIALEIDNTIEEDIQIYKTLSSRGINLNAIDNSEYDGLNSEYLSEVLSEQTDLPPLKSKDGYLIKEYNSGNREVMKNYTSEKEKYNLIEENEKLKKEIERLKNNIPSDLTEENETEIDNPVEIKDSPEAILQKELEKLTNRNNKLRMKENIQKKEYSSIVYPEIYQVFIISAEDTFESIEGYSFNRVDTIDDLNLFTSSKHNLLILSDSIDTSLYNNFIGWIKTISKEDSKYRILKFTDSNVKLPGIIEGEIELTKEDLDNYYNSHPITDYLNNGIRDFNRID